jgi:hypothetical protein
MRAMPHEIRLRYQVTNDTMAILFDKDAFESDDQDFGVDEVVVRAGSTVFADLEAWRGEHWKGEEIVSFFSELQRCYTNRDRFLSSIVPLPARTE